MDYEHTVMNVCCSQGLTMPSCTFFIKILSLRQNGHQFADDIFKCIFLNENVWIVIKI